MSARFLISAAASGSGKTLLTCGILQALLNQGKKVISFKCGPDYIDPMFHSRVIGTKSRNLDTFFAGDDVVRYLLDKNSKDCDIAVLEGVMGYYDGVGGTTVRASAYDVARVTNTPVIFIVNCKGASVSLVPAIKGFLDYDPKLTGCKDEEDARWKDEKDAGWKDEEDAGWKDEEDAGWKDAGKIGNIGWENDRKTADTNDHVEGNRSSKDRETGNYIRGVILNQISPMLYPRMKSLIESQLNVKVIGYVPYVKDCVFESRHLGLVMPEEIADLKERIGRLAGVMEETIDWEALMEIAEGANVPDDLSEYSKHASLEYRTYDLKECDRYKSEKMLNLPSVRIGVAKDEAFCFFYEDNFELLRQMGAEIIWFSPLHDKKLPDHLQGVMFHGGYPELYAKELSENSSMRRSVREALENGLPCMAECGGFMYLHEQMEDMKHTAWPMVGTIPGYVRRTDRLGRFGYITLEEGRVFGVDAGAIPSHEFHYFDSDCCGEAFVARKPGSSRSWKCIHSTDTLFAGFPHLYFCGNPKVAQAFVEACKKKG